MTKHPFASRLVAGALVCSLAFGAVAAPHERAIADTTTSTTTTTATTGDSTESTDSNSVSDGSSDSTTTDTAAQDTWTGLMSILTFFLGMLAFSAFIQQVLMFGQPNP
ncbi:MAG: hypothetical protein Q3962_03260 [Corynebacterium sp.]|nr:hypothetical protein [Corynebacterium sp.]